MSSCRCWPHLVLDAPQDDECECGQQEQEVATGCACGPRRGRDLQRVAGLALRFQLSQQVLFALVALVLALLLLAPLLEPFLVVPLSIALPLHAQLAHLLLEVVRCLHNVSGNAATAHELGSDACSLAPSQHTRRREHSPRAPEAETDAWLQAVDVCDGMPRQSSAIR